MASEMQSNPYVPPESDLSGNADEGKAALNEFERFSAWGVFFLSVITLGIYQIYWIFTRTRTLNEISERKISATFVNTTVSLYVVHIVMSAVDTYLGSSNEALTIASGLSSVLVAVLAIVWVFGFRNRLHEVMGVAKGDALWFGPVLTFFFQEIYLQYKINQVIDEQQS